MKKIDQASIGDIKNHLTNVHEILIVTHYNPDGDAIGSSLALFHFLDQRGYRVNVVVPNHYPDFLRWLPGNEHIIIAENEPDKTHQIINRAELIIFLDFNVLDRTQQLENIFRNTHAPKILIDHHPQPEHFADIIVNTVQVSSTAELLYELIAILGDSDPMSKNIAECLYTGIMTDTGSFSYNSSLPETYYVVSKLLECGIDKDKIYWQVYNHYSIDRMQLLGYCLYQKLKVFKAYGASYISINSDEQDRFKYQTGDSEGFVNYPLSIHGIMFSAIFIERKDHVKISFRSKGDFPANTFAANHFNGGGHRNAAGGYSELSLKETLNKFESLLSQYKVQLLENHIDDADQ